MAKKKWKMLTALLLVIVMVFALAACGGSDSNNDQQGEPEESESAEKGGDLVVATYTDGSNCIMDPQMTWSYGDWQLNNQLYDTLVTTDFDGQTLKDALAESWEVSEDGLTYTFHLKEGIKFHSGKALTSDDVKRTFTRWQTDPAAEYSYYLDFVEEMECPDDQTVILKLSKPDNNLLINLTTPLAGIMNIDAVEQAEKDGKVYGVEVVDGTGPFKLVEYVNSDHITMERNEEYAWGSSIYENDGAPYLKTLTYRYIPEAGTRLMELKGGTVDVLGNGCVFANELEGLAAEGYGIYEYTPPYPVFFTFQMNRVTDKNVRIAMNMAYDREEEIATVMYGHAVPMIGALPSDYPTYWKGQDDLYPYDVDAANKLLEDSGYILSDDGYRYKDGKKLTYEISYCSSDEDAKSAELFQAQMKKIGIDITINTSVSDFWERVGGDGGNNFDILIMGLYINTTEDMLQEYMYSKNMPSPNRSGWSSPEADELLVTARSTTDQELKQQCYDRVQQIAMEEEVLWLPMYSRNGWSVAQPWVKGLKAHPTIVEGETKYIDVYIEK